MHAEALAKPTAQCLKILSEQTFLNSYYLAGGTAVALHLGHRRSEDLDFFTSEKIDSLKLRELLQSLGKFILDEESPGTLHGNLEGVKVSFLEYPYPTLESTSNYLGIQIAGKKDLAAMKLDAIASRGKKRDFVDIFALAKAGMSLKEMLLFFENKYQSLHYNLAHTIKSLTYFRDADSDPDPVFLIKMDWNEVKTFFEREAVKLI